jgi:hypothetical protein
METTTEAEIQMKNIEVIHNVRVKDVKVGDRIHQHGGGERTVIETRHHDGGKFLASSVVLVTVSDTDNEAHQDWYPVTSKHIVGGFYKVPTIVTEEAK